MGNYCTRGTGGLKECVKHELTALLCNVIAEDSKGYTTDFTVPQVRLQAIKKGMSLARSQGGNWPHLLHLGLLISKPSHVSVSEVAECMGYNLKNVFKIGHIMALCTYVADICVVKMCKNELVDVYATVDSLVSFLVDKNIEMCVDFLKHLDSCAMACDSY